MNGCQSLFEKLIVGISLVVLGSVGGIGCRSAQQTKQVRPIGCTKNDCPKPRTGRKMVQTQHRSARMNTQRNTSPPTIDAVTASRVETATFALG